MSHIWYNVFCWNNKVVNLLVAFFTWKKKVNSSLCLGQLGISWSGTTSTVLSLTLSWMNSVPVWMIHTSRTEKARVKKVPNPWLPQPRPQHLVAVLQRLTQVTKSHTVLQVEEEIRTLPLEKLKVLTNFPREKMKSYSEKTGGTEGRNWYPRSLPRRYGTINWHWKNVPRWRPARENCSP